MMNLFKFFISIIPFSKKVVSYIYYRWIICVEKKKHRHALKMLYDKEKIKCVFFALDSSVWKYDGVFKKMQEDPRFEPLVLVCPIVNYGKESMLRKMEEAYQCYKSKGYPTIKAYDENNDKYVDVRNELKPDVIAYTNPYRGLIDERYYITNFLDILSIYVHYGYNSVTKWDLLYHQLLTNRVWRYYIETPYHLDYVKKHSYNKGVNGYVTGYPGIEEFQDNKYEIKDIPWKIKDRSVKRIIWAPHHSIEQGGVVHFSNFLKYADFMIRMAEKYVGKVQISFKPHPILRDKLVKLWGESKTEIYYKKWEQMPNTFVSEGEYIDLFLSSDAMIHDSGSFLIEYLYTKKPVMRLMNGDNIEELLNSFASRCFEAYYKGYDEKEIEEFINNVIDGIDKMKDMRLNLYKELLQPINGKLPSENIIDDIVYSIDNQVLYRN